MSSFDPNRPVMVHDRHSDRWLAWEPLWAFDFRRAARVHDEGVMNWNGLVLDAWTEPPDLASEPLDGLASPDAS